MNKPTKAMLAEELSRYTGLSKSHYIKSMKKDQIEAALEEVHRQGLRPKKGKHVYFGTPKRRSSKLRSRRGSKIRSRRSTPVKVPTKKDLIDEVVRYTGRPKARYKDWEKVALMQRLEALRDSGARPLKGKVVKLGTPIRKKSIRRSRRRRSSSKAKVQCKSYQVRNSRGRCVNKPCKNGKIRDRKTKKCRNKKSR